MAGSSGTRPQPPQPPHGNETPAGEWRIAATTHTPPPPVPLAFDECLAVERMETRWEDAISWEGEFRDAPLCIDTPAFVCRPLPTLSGEPAAGLGRDYGLSLVEWAVNPPYAAVGSAATLTTHPVHGPAIAGDDMTTPVSEVPPAPTDFVHFRSGALERRPRPPPLRRAPDLLHSPSYALWKARASGTERRVHTLARPPACNPDALARYAQRKSRVAGALRRFAVHVQGDPWNAVWATDQFLRGRRGTRTRVVDDAVSAAPTQTIARYRSFMWTR